MKSWFAIFLMLASLSCAAHGQSTAPASYFDPSRHMRVAEVRPGMKGYGLTVFEGSRIDRFDIEVISVLKNFNPKSDVILVRCSGANLEHTGAIAGMSGSPCYLLDDQGRYRLAGAFAFGWSMTKDPLGGLQPIEYMLDVGPSGSAGAAGASDNSKGLINYVYDPAKLEKGLWPAPSRMSNEAVQLQPLATPLMSAGLSPRAIEHFSPIFRAQGLVPLQAGAATSSPSTQPISLAPGSVLAAPLLDGDVTLTAIGTCTEVINGRVFGFGHPFNNEGAISLPMGAGLINAVIPSLSQSFKIGSVTNISGTLTSDQAAGVSGVIGKTPPTVPIDFHIIYTDGSLDQFYHFEAVSHPKLTPLVTMVALSAALSGRHELPDLHTLHYDVQLDFENSQSVKISNIAVNSAGPELLRHLIVPISFAADNPFQKLQVKKITGTIRVTPEAHEADILSVDLAKTRFRPDETIHGMVRYRPFRAAEKTLPIELQLPRDIPDGKYDLSVCDQAEYVSQEQQARPYRFTAQNVQDVFSVLNDITSIREDAVYVRLIRQADGVAIGHTAMPRLPGSRRQILLDSGRSEVTPLTSAAVRIFPSDYAMSGSDDVEIEVESGEHHPGQPKHQEPPPPIKAPPALPGHRAEPDEPMPDMPGDAP